MALHSEEPLLATGSTDSGARLFNVSTGRLVASFDEKSNEESPAVEVVALFTATAVDAALLAVGKKDGVVDIWDCGHQVKRHTVSIERGAISSIHFQPNVDNILCGSTDDGYLWCCDIRTLDSLSPFIAHRAAILDTAVCVADTPEGKVFRAVSASDDCTVKLWDFKLHDESRGDGAQQASPR
eukprot:GHVU01222321.1.p2 GENE.GHVU01222321.1~~GHVU01222321.1.p2  ORF type:complete len:183 (+),score=23.75 GHVU01222321.1:1166-1714(+)